MEYPLTLKAVIHLGSYVHLFVLCSSLTSATFKIVLEKLVMCSDIAPYFLWTRVFHQRLSKFLTIIV